MPRWFVSALALAHLVFSSLLGAPTAKPLPSISKLVSLARPFAADPARHNGVPINDRLAVTYLHSVNGIESEATRQSTLFKSITLLLKHIGPATPLDIYIFVAEAQAPLDPGVHAFSAVAPNIAVLPVLAEHWHRHHRENYMQDGLLDMGDYHIMGQWRLEVQFTFGALMGYEYVMQFDDDSYMVGPYPHNLLERLRAKNALMGGARILQDPPFFFNGLPELARAFIVMHSGEHAYIYDRVLPPEELFNLSSALYKHCNPPTIMGLHSMVNNSLGYDNSYVFGNFLIMKTHLWMKPLVQDFVQLCLLSGGVYRYRWIDQAVEAFIWLMFVEEQQFVLFSDVPYHHGKPYMTEAEYDVAMAANASAVSYRSK